MRASIGRGRAADRVERAGCANVSGELHLNRLYVELGQSRNAPASCGRMNRTTKPTRPGCTRTAFLAHRYPCHVRTGHRPRDPRAALDRHEDLLRMPHRVRRSAEHERLSGVSRPPRRAARAEPARRRARRCARRWRSGAVSTSSRSSRGRTTSTPTCPRATRSRNTISRSATAGRRVRCAVARRDRRDHPRAHGGGRRQVAARGRSRSDRRRRRLQPQRCAADRDRHRARPAVRRGCGGVLRDAAGPAGLRSASTTATWKRAASAATPTSRSARRHGDARHEGRDQEPELVPLSAEGARPRDRPTDRVLRRRARRAGDAAVGPRHRAYRRRCAARKRRTTTGTSRSRICRRSWWTRPRGRRSAGRCRSCPTRGAPRFVADYALSGPRGGCAHAVAARSPTTSKRPRAAAGNPKAASNWIMGELVAKLNDRGLSD